jgi:hypothetical protein
VTAKTGCGYRRTARLLAAAAATAVVAAAAATTAHASQPERISLPYSCRIEQGRLRLDPAPEQIYQLTGGRDQRAFTFCPERQSCQTVAVHRFTVSCGGQRAPWADIVAAVAERGHPKLAVAHGRLGLLARPGFAARAEPPPAPPSNGFLSGWCSDQFGGPSQPFLRQACNEARRFASNLGGPALAVPARSLGIAIPQFIALPKGFAPMGDVGARLLPPVAAALPPAPEPSAASPPLGAAAIREVVAETAIGQAPTLSTPEPNDRTNGAAPPRRPLPQPSVPHASVPHASLPHPSLPHPSLTAATAATAEAASAWITSVHLASASVAASSEAAAERQRASRSERTMSVLMVLAGVLASAGALLAVRWRRQQQQRLSLAAATRATAPLLARLGASEGSSPSDHAPQRQALPWPSSSQLKRRLNSRLAGLRGHVRKVLAQSIHRAPAAAPGRERPPLTAEHLAAVAALPPQARLIITAREHAADRIHHLRQTLAPLTRTAPSLHAALARDLIAGDRRLGKITIASLSAAAVSMTVGEIPADGAHDGGAQDQQGHQGEQDVARKRAQSRLQRVTSDLDRLQEIIAGAIASQTRGNGPRPLPRDVSEAFAVLGVNAGVPGATLKKLVDALRVSWHPDLATSDEDRRHRDERIKEINVAWDLIAGKRAAE